MTGRALTPSSDDPVQALWTAPRVIVAHGDPIFLWRLSGTAAGIADIHGAAFGLAASDQNPSFSSSPVNVRY